MISSFGQLRGPPYCLQKEKKSLHFFLCGNFHTVFYFILCISLLTFSCPRTQAITRNVQLKLSLMFTSTIVFKIRWGAQVTPLSYCGQPVISRLQSTSAPLDNSFLVTERLFSSQVSIYDIWILHIDALPSYKNGKLTEWEICRYWVLVCVFSACGLCFRWNISCISRMIILTNW